MLPAAPGVERCVKDRIHLPASGQLPGPPPLVESDGPKPIPALSVAGHQSDPDAVLRAMVKSIALSTAGAMRIALRRPLL